MTKDEPEWERIPGGLYGAAEMLDARLRAWSEAMVERCVEIVRREGLGEKAAQLCRENIGAQFGDAWREQEVEKFWRSVDDAHGLQ